MDWGAAMLFTDHSIGPAALGRAREGRGSGSLWAPERSHIPLSRSGARATPTWARASGARRFRRGGALPNKYAGAARLIFNLAPAKADEVLPVLDRCAQLVRQVGS